MSELHALSWAGKQHHPEGKQPTSPTQRRVQACIHKKGPTMRAAPNFAETKLKLNHSIESEA